MHLARFLHFLPEKASQQMLRLVQVLETIN